MKSRVALSRFALAVAITGRLLTSPLAFSQTAAVAETRPPGAVLVKLTPPAYPRLAQQAHIAGDVEIRPAIRQDGSVESAEPVSGHPMLQQAALEGAERSHFECHGSGRGEGH